MQRDEFFAYLERSEATRLLAGELSALLELRTDVRRRVAAKVSAPHAA